MSSGSLITEEKPMHLQYLGKCAQPVAALSKYADPSTVKASFRGKEVTPCGFTDYNDPFFSHELYWKLEEIREVNEAWELPEEKVLITYREKELVPGPEIFDTLEGIIGYVKDLKTLWDIINNRRLYYHRYKKPGCLENYFIIFGKIAMNYKGSYSALFEFPHLEEDIYTKIIHVDTFKRLLGKGRPNESLLCDIPKENSVCNVCGKKWTLDDLKGPIENLDYVGFGIGDSYGEYHVNCLKQKNLEADRKEFCEIVSAVYPDIVPPEIISSKKLFWVVAESEPQRTQYFNAQFKFSTPDGDIIIFRDDIFEEKQITIRWYENSRLIFRYEILERPIESKSITVSSKEDAIKYLKAAKLSR